MSMREEFEAWVVTQGSSIKRCGPPADPSPVYMYVETNAMWLAWKASREAMGVELPDLLFLDDGWNGRIAAYAAEDIRAAIELAGVKVKP